MFDELVETAGSRRTTSRWTVALSAVLQVAVIVVLILIPLAYTQALPNQFLRIFLAAPLPPAGRPHPPSIASQRTKAPAHLFRSGILTAPAAIPPKVQMVNDADAPDVGADCGNCVPGGIPGGDSSGIMSTITGAVGTNPVPPPPAKQERTPIRVGGNVQAAKLISQIQPRYPEVARAVRISGTVMLHAIIGKNGRVEQLQYISGPALLMTSAMDAVRQWRYLPTMLNGEPVEVDTTISVVFALGE